jgi:hypothetical protein
MNFFPRSKYKNKKCVVDNIIFDSMHESRKYIELKMLKSGGAIKDFKLQVPFSFELNGKKICKYYADFVVEYHDGHTEIIDCKGFKTPVYNLKKKMMKAFYGIDIVEIK